MTNFNVARGKNEPINRFGVDSVQFEASEGDLVSVTTDADGEVQLVEADATNGPALGMAIAEVRDLSNLSGALDNLERDLATTNDYTLIGDRIVAVRYGLELVNDDDDTDWTPGEPVYLAEGGGYTQTEPSSSGSVVQIVGVALGPNDRGTPNGGGGKDRMVLDVANDYTTVA